MLQSNDSSGLNNGEEPAAASLQPMGFSDILDNMFSLYRNHFRLFVTICSIYFICGFVVNLLIGCATVSATGAGEFNMLMLAVVTGILSLINTVVMLLVIGGLVFVSAQVFLGKPITAGMAFKQTKRRFWSFFFSNLLYGIVVIALIVPNVILLGLLVSGIWRSLATILVVGIISIIAALFVGVCWIFCSQAAVFEEKSAVRALKRSNELVKGGWWRVFGMMIGIFLLVFFVQSILQFSLLFVLGLSQTMGGDGNSLEMLRQMFIPQLTTWDEFIAYSIRNFVGLAITSLMLPVGIIGATMVYFDQRIRKEGFDIEMRATSEPT